MSDLKFSDFLRQTQEPKAKVFCNNCSHCVMPMGMWQYAQCKAAYQDNQAKHIGKNIIEGQYIELLLKWGQFPNIDGHCNLYEKKWWKFWVK